MSKSITNIIANRSVNNRVIVIVAQAIGYEPADGVQQMCTPPPELPRVGSFFSYRCLVFPKKMSSTESLCFLELLRLKDPKTWFFTIFTQIKFW